MNKKRAYPVYHIANRLKPSCYARTQHVEFCSSKVCTVLFLLGPFYRSIPSRFFVPRPLSCQDIFGVAVANRPVYMRHEMHLVVASHLVIFKAIYSFTISLSVVFCFMPYENIE